MKKMRTLLTIAAALTILVGCSTAKKNNDEQLVDPPTYFEEEDTPESVVGQETVVPKNTVIDKTINHNGRGHIVANVLYDDGSGNQHVAFLVFDEHGTVIRQIGDKETRYRHSRIFDVYDTGVVRLEVPDTKESDSGDVIYLDGIMNIDGSWVIEPKYEQVYVHAGGNFFTAEDHKYDDFEYIGSDLLVFNRDGKLIKTFEMEFDKTEDNYVVATRDTIAVRDLILKQNGESVTNDLKGFSHGHYGRIFGVKDRSAVFYDKDLNRYQVQLATEDTRLGNKYRIEFPYENQTTIYPINSSEELLSVPGYLDLLWNDLLVDRGLGEVYTINDNGTTELIADYHSMAMEYQPSNRLVAHTARENGEPGYLIVFDTSGKILLDESLRLTEIEDSGRAVDIDGNVYILNFDTTTLTPLSTFIENIDHYLNK